MARCVIESREERVVLGDVIRFAADVFREFEDCFSARIADDDRIRSWARISARCSVNIRDMNSRGWCGGMRFGKKTRARWRRSF